jgi:hypothetical protein
MTFLLLVLAGFAVVALITVWTSRRSQGPASRGRHSHGGPGPYADDYSSSDSWGDNHHSHHSGHDDGGSSWGDSGSSSGD